MHSFINFGVIPSGGNIIKPLVLMFRDSADSTGNLGTYTFSSQSIGTASSDRYVVVVAMTHRNAVNNVINSVTVGGAATTQVVSYDTSGGGTGAGLHRLGIFITNVPYTSGTTADIVVTADTICNSACCFVYSLTGDLNSKTPTATYKNNNANSSFTATVSDGGVVLASRANLNTGAHTWSGMTENAEIVSMGDVGINVSVAQSAVSGSKTCTVPTSFSPITVAAAWR